MLILFEEAVLEAMARVCLAAFVGFATGLLSPETAARRDFRQNFLRKTTSSF